MSTRYSKSSFVSPDDPNTRLTIVLDNKPTKGTPPRPDEKKEFFDDIVKTT